MGTTTQHHDLLGSYTPPQQRRGLDRIIADIDNLLPQVRQGEPLGDLDRERDRLDAAENQPGDRWDGLG